MAFKLGKITGKTEWISPHKLSLLVLIRALCRKDSEDIEYSECIIRCRHSLSLFMLEILQVLFHWNNGHCDDVDKEDR